MPARAHRRKCDLAFELFAFVYKSAPFLHMKRFFLLLKIFNCLFGVLFLECRLPGTGSAGFYF